MKSKFLQTALFLSTAALGLLSGREASAQSLRAPPGRGYPNAGGQMVGGNADAKLVGEINELGPQLEQRIALGTQAVVAIIQGQPAAHPQKIFLDLAADLDLKASLLNAEIARGECERSAAGRVTNVPGGAQLMQRFADACFNRDHATLLNAEAAAEDQRTQNALTAIQQQQRLYPNRLQYPDAEVAVRTFIVTLDNRGPETPGVIQALAGTVRQLGYLVATQPPMQQFIPQPGYPQPGYPQQGVPPPGTRMLPDGHLHSPGGPPPGPSTTQQWLQTPRLQAPVQRP